MLALGSDMGVGVAVSVVLHVLVLGLVGFSWSSNPELVRPPKAPSFVQAVVMDVPKSSPKPTVQPKPKPKPKPNPKTESKPVTKPKVEPKPEAKIKTESAVEPADPPTLSSLDLAKMLAEEELNMQQSVEPEQAVEPTQSEEGQHSDEQAQQDAQAVSSYSDAISSVISSRWILPATAREKTGLEAFVRVHLLPGGEVLDVKLVQSSGDNLFDQSALTAVRSAGSLPVPSGELFNEQFRVFTFRFYPELKTQ